MRARAPTHLEAVKQIARQVDNAITVELTSALTLQIAEGLRATT